MTGETLCRGLTPTRAVLDNGAVILAQEIGGIPAVALNATFCAGSITDPDDLPGVAYLARRTIDRGTATRSAADIADTLDDRGVSLRVSLSRHTLSISCVCLSEDFEDILNLLAEIARQPVFPENEIEKRRVEAITSIREDHDDPARVAGDLLLEALYGVDHPYGRSLKGTLDSLERVRRDDLIAYHARRIVPSSLRLAIAGDVPEAAMLFAAARAFSGWHGPAMIEDPVPPPPRRHARGLRVRAMPGKSQTDIAYGFTTIRRLDPRYYAYWMMNDVLGQFGLGGRLANNIRERQGMAYYAYSTLDAMLAEGPLTIHAGVAPGNVHRAIGAIDTEVRRLRDEGPTIDELEETRESLIGSIPRMLETSEGVTDFLLHIEHFGLGLDYDRRLPELLREVTLDDVREAAGEALHPSRAAVAIAGPILG